MALSGEPTKRLFKKGQIGDCIVHLDWLDQAALFWNCVGKKKQNQEQQQQEKICRAKCIQ